MEISRAALVLTSTGSLVFPGPAPLTQVTVMVYVVNDLRSLRVISVSGPLVLMGLCGVSSNVASSDFVPR